MKVKVWLHFPPIGPCWAQVAPPAEVLDCVTPQGGARLLQRLWAAGLLPDSVGLALVLQGVTEQQDWGALQALLTALPPNTPLAVYQVALEACMAHQRLECLGSLLQQMAKSGHSPSAKEYDRLLLVLAEAGLLEQVEAMWQALMEAEVIPSRHTCAIRPASQPEGKAGPSICPSPVCTPPLCWGGWPPPFPKGPSGPPLEGQPVPLF